VGYGGATWDTAGTLTSGTDNTFNVADATTDDILNHQAWWKITPGASGVVTFLPSPAFGGDDGFVNMKFYSGASEAAKVEVFFSGFSGGAVSYPVTGGVEYHALVGTFSPTGPPTTYQLTFTQPAVVISPWFSTLRNNDENWVVLPGSELNEGNSFPFTEAWMDDCVRPGSFRSGDVTYQETLGGPWDTQAADCAIEHAMWGNQFSDLWDGTCPPKFDGPADLEEIGESSVGYHYSDNPVPFPAGSDSAHMIVNTVSYGVWLKPVEENLTERGVLAVPDPEDYGYPADAILEWESDTVELWKVEIADAGGSAVSGDPDSRYAVNHNRQPTFDGGAWDAWRLGGLPGTPVTPPAWADGPEDYSITFASEGVDHADKTWHVLDVPADGFDSLTQDYLTDTYDYGVIAGPAEAFGERAFTADRIASTGLIVKVYVRSPRFRFIYVGEPTAVPPRRIFGRADGATHGTPRVRGGGNTVQSGSRTLGAIL
jgi:hypothetical protein